MLHFRQYYPVFVESCRFYTFLGNFPIFFKMERKTVLVYFEIMVIFYNTM